MLISNIRKPLKTGVKSKNGQFLEVTLYNIKPVLLLTFMKQIATIRKKTLTNQS